MNLSGTCSDCYFFKLFDVGRERRVVASMVHRTTEEGFSSNGVLIETHSKRRIEGSKRPILILTENEILVFGKLRNETPEGVQMT